MDRSRKLKDLCDELLNHVTKDPLRVASCVELWLIKRHDNEDANLKALREFTNTARELGVTVVCGPLESPRHYVLKVTATVRALDALAKTNHNIDTFLPYQTIQLN